jgi:hypothetical protein
MSFSLCALDFVPCWKNPSVSQWQKGMMVHCAIEDAARELQQGEAGSTEYTEEHGAAKPQPRRNRRKEAQEAQGLSIWICVSCASLRQEIFAGREEVDG